MRPKILPTTLACLSSSVIWPRQAAVVHSLERPTFFATSAHWMPLDTFTVMIFSVTSLRFMAFCGRTDIEKVDSSILLPGSF